MSNMIFRLEEIDPVLIKEKEKLESLFKIKLEDIKVMTLRKRDFTKIVSSPDWIVGFAIPRKNMIVAIEQEESGRNYPEWIKLIVHEMVHLFSFTKFGTDKPTWFFEGLACYLAGQDKRTIEIKAEDLIDKFHKSDKDSYVMGYSVIKKILEK